MKAKALPTVLVTGILLTAPVLLVPGGVVRDGVYQVLIWLGVAAVLLGVRLHAPADPVPWWLLAGGVGTLALSAIDPHLWWPEPPSALWRCWPCPRSPATP